MTILTSGAVERAILYCGGEYDKCEIYGRLAMRQRQESDPVGESGSMADPGGQRKEGKDPREKTEAARFPTGTRSTSGETP